MEIEVARSTPSIDSHDRTWLRKHAKIIKRYLIHVAAFNLCLVMRAMPGNGTPKGLADRLSELALTQRTESYLTGPWEVSPPAGYGTSSTGC